MVNEIHGTFTCDECETEFPDRALLVNHMDNIHTENGENRNNANNSTKNYSDDEIEEKSYREKAWPGGFQMFGKSKIFEDAVVNLKDALKKGTTAYMEDDIIIKVQDVVVKVGSTEMNIGVSHKKRKWKCQCHFLCQEQKK